MKLKRGDVVKFTGFFAIGYVRRVARDGSWVDVDWGTWTKRQRLPATGLLKIEKQPTEPKWKKHKKGCPAILAWDIPGACAC